MTRTLAAIAAALAAAASAPAWAHHSASLFDLERLVTVTGTVKTFQYANPHSWLLVEVEAPTGAVTDWRFEAQGPAILHRSGLTRTMVKPGDKVTVTGRPLKDGRPVATLVELKKADGTVLLPKPD